ncbi:MAG: FAD-dependent oxidoreductase [Gemmatimonadetes bacterium]|nr:FAD-dependent oxidoreductase [Gemmatimonadota bacterium]NIR77755.1 FAD-dependent oxidoreductase [Gemmatimonadota bacterium]NIT86291.1 FAD-dependent oxidoreductase [Gemmatimonadota bacterium]NIU30125.1 FAD-dependent oxidoreductase [Gemmatimonadota bacterium]NIV60519.1 FAD-dependent oxidoreductase [Gemmatimonadota bacterium]
MARDRPRIAILGAGPVGLDAALAALDGGYPFAVYEAAPEPAANVLSWGHVRLFSPWSLDVSPRMAHHLREAGRKVPTGEACPTGDELVDRVLGPVAGLPAVREGLRLGTRVVRVGREGMLKHDAIGTGERGRRPFRLLLADGESREWVEHADVVLDCTGSYTHPNAMGDGGIPAPGERALGERIRRTIPDVAADADAWAGQRILVVGAGHSAQTAARDLAELAASRPGTRILWSVREAEPEWNVIPDDPLPRRRELGEEAAALAAGDAPGIELRPGTAVDALEPNGEGIRVRLRRGDGPVEDVGVDRILSLTGYVGDHRIYRQLQVHECYATSGPMKLAAALLGQDSADCLAQESQGAETLMNPEPGFFILGVKSYGRNNTFLMRVGWQQVDEVFGALEEGE